MESYFDNNTHSQRKKSLKLRRGRWAKDFEIDQRPLRFYLNSMDLLFV